MVETAPVVLAAAPLGVVAPYRAAPCPSVPTGVLVVTPSAQDTYNIILPNFSEDLWYFKKKFHLTTVATAKAVTTVTLRSREP